MNNGQKILLGSCAVVTLMGLGFLAHYVYGGDKADLPENEPQKEPAKRAASKESSYNHSTGKRPAKKPESGQRHQQKPKPEAKVEMVEIEESEPPVADEFPLRLRSEGKRVERLQIWLMRNYGRTGNITGRFDQKTEALLKRFLKKTELDRETYNKLKMGQPVYEQIVMR